MAALAATVTLPDIATLRGIIHIHGLALPEPFEQMVSRYGVEQRLVEGVDVSVDQTELNSGSTWMWLAGSVSKS